MPGITPWEDMNWLFPDFEISGLIYHGADPSYLQSIFQKGLIPRFLADPSEKHDTIYNTLYKHRAPDIPKWVDPRACLFGYVNRKRQGGTAPISDGQITNVSLGIKAIPQILNDTWVACNRFSDLIYCPQEAGYFDTKARKAYWKSSLSFEDNLKIRLDHLLPLQNHLELLICVKTIPPDLLTLQSFRVKGSDGTREILRIECEPIFEVAEKKLRSGTDISAELSATSQHAAKDKHV